MKRCLHLLWCCLLVSPIALGQSPKITRGPYLQKAYTNAWESSITIRWRTNEPTIGRVYYSANPDYQLLGSASSFKDETTSSTEHIVTLTGLSPSQRYRYYISTTTNLELEKSPDHFFTAPPIPWSIQNPNHIPQAKKVKMWVLGDFGAFPASNSQNRQDSTIAAFRDFMTKNKTGPMDLWLWLGDNAYSGGNDFEFQDKVFDKGRGRYDWIFRQTPFYSVVGNHEYQYQPPLERNRLTHDIDYFKIVSTFQNGEGGGEPSGKKEYYSFDYYNIHIIALDSYGYEKAGDTYDSILSPSSEQYKWLERDLKKAQSDHATNWIIVMLHHPPYTGGTHNSDLTTQPDVELGALRRNLVPLLDKYKVDLVMSGHSHGYERTKLMKKHTEYSNFFDANKHTPAIESYAQGSGRYDGISNSCFYHKKSAAPENEGIVYIVNGAGGADQEFVQNAPLIGKLMASSWKRGGSLYLEVDYKKLTGKFITVDKTVVDEFTIYKDTDNFTVPNTDGTTRTAVCECTDYFTEDTRFDYKYFTHYFDNKGNILLSINKLGHNIGKTGVPPFEVKLGGAKGKQNVGAFFNERPGNYVRTDKTRTLGSGWQVMNRYWTVKPQTELTGNQQVIVRHYYKLYDALDDLGSYGGGLTFYKINSLSKEYTIDPQSGIHNSLPGAVSYNQDGIWLYDPYGRNASISGYSYINGLAQIQTQPYKGYPFGFPYTRDSTTDNAAKYSGEFIVGRLNGGGGIGRGINPRGSLVVLESGSEWLFYAKGQAPPDVNGFNWKGGQDYYYFDDVRGETRFEGYFKYATDWMRGPAPLGYSPRDADGNGKDGEKTLIPACQSELDCYQNEGQRSFIRNGCASCGDQRWITTYYRNRFKSFSDNSANNSLSFYKSIIINYKRDDGVIIYFNGKEISQRDENMPPKSEVPIVTFDTRAKVAANEQEWVSIVIPVENNLTALGGEVAVELHQNLPSSSDAHFDMEIILSPDAPPASGRLAALEDPLPTEPITILYPNPTENGKVFFNETVSYENFRIVDARGIVLRYVAEPGTMKELDVSGLAAGTYILSSQNKDKTSHFRIVKK